MHKYHKVCEKEILQYSKQKEMADRDTRKLLTRLNKEYPEISLADLEQSLQNLHMDGRIDWRGYFIFPVKKTTLLPKDDPPKSKGDEITFEQVSVKTKSTKRGRPAKSKTE